MSFFHWLTLLLIAAKLFGYFPYSWWWAVSPFLLVCLIGAIYGYLEELARQRAAERRRPRDRFKF